MSRPKKNMLRSVLNNQLNKAMAPSTSKATANMLHSLAIEYKANNPGYNESEMNRFLSILREAHGGGFAASVVTATGGRVSELIADLVPVLIEVAAKDMPNVSASLEEFDWHTLFNIQQHRQ